MTHMFYHFSPKQFGQFLTHDVTHSASITTSTYSVKPNIVAWYFIDIFVVVCRGILADGSSIRCCSKDGRSVLPQNTLHFACFPIIIDRDDDFYSQFDQGCINMVRSALAPDGNCQLGFGKQVQSHQFLLCSIPNISFDAHPISCNLITF